MNTKNFSNGIKAKYDELLKDPLKWAIMYNIAQAAVRDDFTQVIKETAENPATTKITGETVKQIINTNNKFAQYVDTAEFVQEVNLGDIGQIHNLIFNATEISQKINMVKHNNIVQNIYKYIKSDISLFFNNTYATIVYNQYTDSYLNASFSKISEIKTFLHDKVFIPNKITKPYDNIEKKRIIDKNGDLSEEVYASVAYTNSTQRKIANSYVKHLFYEVLSEKTNSYIIIVFINLELHRLKKETSEAHLNDNIFGQAIFKYDRLKAYLGHSYVEKLRKEYIETAVNQIKIYKDREKDLLAEKKKIKRQLRKKARREKKVLNDLISESEAMNNIDTEIEQIGIHRGLLIKDKKIYSTQNADQLFSSGIGGFVETAQKLSRLGIFNTVKDKAKHQVEEIKSKTTKNKPTLDDKGKEEASDSEEEDVFEKEEIANTYSKVATDILFGYPVNNVGLFQTVKYVEKEKIVYVDHPITQSENIFSKVGKITGDVNLPEDANLPENANLPEDANLPENANLPEDANLPENANLPEDVNFDGPPPPPPPIFLSLGEMDEQLRKMKEAKVSTNTFIIPPDERLKQASDPVFNNLQIDYARYEKEYKEFENNDSTKGKMNKYSALFEMERILDKFVDLEEENADRLGTLDEERKKKRAEAKAKKLDAIVPKGVEKVSYLEELNKRLNKEKKSEKLDTLAAKNIEEERKKQLKEKQEKEKNEFGALMFSKLKKTKKTGSESTKKLVEDDKELLIEKLEKEKNESESFGLSKPKELKKKKK